MGQLSANRRCAVALAVGVATCVVLAGTARAQQPPRVAVIVAVTVNVSVEDARVVAVALGAAMKRELAIDLMSPEEVASRLPPGGLTDICVVEPKCVTDVGSRLGADHLVILAMVRVGVQLKIDPIVVDVATGTSEARQAIVVEKGVSPAYTFVGVARALLPKVPLATAKDTRPVDVVPDPIVQVDQPAGRGRHMTTGSWIATGVGAVALIAGAGFGLSALSGEQDLKDRGCDQMQCDQDDIDRVDRRALYSDLFIGAGLAASVTAVVLYLRSGQAAPPVRVGATRSGVVFAVGGRF